jgi:anti-sigma regulatory factor (Ser/Thr protein kinase)
VTGNADLPAGAARTRAGLRHMFYPYRGEKEYLSGTLAYIERARANGAPVIVAAPPGRREALRARLGDAPTVEFVDTGALGRNPGRLIPVWREWIRRYSRAGRVFALNELVGCSAGGTVRQGELRYQEWLLARAFAGAPAWSMICPFDTTGHTADTVRSLARCHPLVWTGSGHAPGDGYAADGYPLEPLEEPRGPVETLRFAKGDLAAVRTAVAVWAAAHRLGSRRIEDLALAVTEVAANSISYGGGAGTLRLWAVETGVVCEVHDEGVITDPLVGTTPPAPTQLGGRGLWFVHQLCDLVQIRSSPGEGTRVRLHVDLSAER